MHKNEAIAQVAQQAMEQIFDIAQYAISQIADTGAEIDLSALSQEYAQPIKVQDEPAKPRAERKPRTPKATEPAKEIEPEFVSADEPAEKQSEVSPEPTSEGDFESEQNEVASEPADESDNPDFPDYSDDWFAKDLERSRNICRDILAKMMGKIGPNETRKNITATTGKSRATDFDVQNCIDFYRAFRNNV